MDLVKVQKLFDEFPLDMVHPLVVENPDWEERLVPALEEVGMAFDNNNMSNYQLASCLRSLIEIAYVIGYQKGGEK